ncbi:uncharacterized protein DUF262 [Archangium gephyra]|uniref:Uncharacterized protein DUF262 n=1 Tax=Archangium gephyra TaxID=48 RepID=A0ABX9K9I3_9BACT|nr:DUF262 domain-containing protein [Archangium gephyra]REG36303.1 uncharacterized protein DUF262 [Archangium gephyra]
MKIQITEPDIQTLVTRINDNVLSLQPDFQRGEVWPESKQQKLIDSILRAWQIPPVHVIVLPENETQEVLDGQQRLAAIRNFVRGEFSVDGYIHPHDPELQNLDGLKFNELPLRHRNQFLRYAIRVVLVTDYAPEEPGELFYRLNQPTALTTAEQRNALYGEARKQIKGLVAAMSVCGLNEETLGFSNARMAYDDVLSRVCATLQSGTLRDKVTSRVIADIYRMPRGFGRSVVKSVERSIFALGQALSSVGFRVRFNKATLYSWLIFFDAALRMGCSSEQLGQFIESFEADRHSSSTNSGMGALFYVYLDRASSRVADTSSVLARDAVIWISLARFSANANLSFGKDASKLLTASTLLKSLPKRSSPSSIEAWLFEKLDECQWGTSL